MGFRPPPPGKLHPFRVNYTYVLTTIIVKAPYCRYAMLEFRFLDFILILSLSTAPLTWPFEDEAGPDPYRQNSECFGRRLRQAIMLDLPLAEPNCLWELLVYTGVRQTYHQAITLLV